MTRLHKHKLLARHVQKNKPTKLVDKLTYIAAVVEPILLYPQAFQIFHYKNAHAVSILTWVGIDILTAVWVWYALVHKQKMILLYQGLFLVANTLIVIGALLYGGKWF